MSSQDPFEGAAVISTYTPEQAVEDGIFADVSEGAKEGGWRIDPSGELGFVAVYMTTNLFHQLEEPWGHEDQRGRTHDVLMLACIALRKAVAASDTLATFKVRWGGRDRDVWAKLEGNGKGQPIVTIMLPEDY